MGPLRKLCFLLLSLYWIGLSVGTHLPGRSIRGIQANDKSLHLLAFMGLAFLMSAALSGWRPSRRSARTVLLTMIAYGGIDEWSQGLVAGRNPDVWDWMADITGACLGVFLYFVVARQIRPLYESLRSKTKSATVPAVQPAREATSEV